MGGRATPTRPVADASYNTTTTLPALAHRISMLVGRASRRAICLIPHAETIAPHHAAQSLHQSAGGDTVPRCPTTPRLSLVSPRLCPRCPLLPLDILSHRTPNDLGHGNAEAPR